jgi:hypothetical protein
MHKVKVYLTRAARDEAIPDVVIQKAAEEAIKKARASGNILFLKFKVRGKWFALSSKLIVEVDRFPHRVPDLVIVGHG